MATSFLEKPSSKSSIATKRLRAVVDARALSGALHGSPGGILDEISSQGSKQTRHASISQPKMGFASTTGNMTKSHAALHELARALGRAEARRRSALGLGEVWIAPVLIVVALVFTVALLTLRAMSVH